MSKHIINQHTMNPNEAKEAGTRQATILVAGMGLPNANKVSYYLRQKIKQWKKERKAAIRSERRSNRVNKN